jgi:hypothetical protein
MKKIIDSCIGWCVCLFFIILFVVLLTKALVNHAQAYEWTPAQAASTQVYVVSNPTNAASNKSYTNFFNIENNDYHTFDFFGTNTGATTITNQGNVVLSHGLDTNAMIAFWTNSITSTNGFVAETNLVGKWKWLEVVTTVTNGNPTFQYLGGR